MSIITASFEDYSATLDTDTDEVTIEVARAGVVSVAGWGEWDGSIEACSADLPSMVYDGLDAAICAALDA